MSDIEPGLEDLRPTPDAPPAGREGLPSSYRMRADAHYVEQLDTPRNFPGIEVMNYARTVGPAELAALGQL